MELPDWLDDSFKYILIGFNFLTLFLIYLHQRRNPAKRQHHILFLIAHPDDECMFFTPTIGTLNYRFFLHILALSGGGTHREEQLKRAVPSAHAIKCINDPLLQDGSKEKWCVQRIQQITQQYVVNNGIKAIFTFDKRGVSEHPNHTAIHWAMKEKQIQLPQTKGIKIYYLESVSLIRKYMGVFQTFIALLRQFSWVNLSFIGSWRGMSAHNSQFVWYRKLWVILSRYTYINTYQVRRVHFSCLSI